MISEDLLAFPYPALIILGVLMSSIPAYIASKRDKNFWLWWISTAVIFAILLLILIENQAIPLMVYLLAIVPVASTLALLPKINWRKIFPPLSNAKEVSKSIRFNEIYSYLLILVLAGSLYYYMLPKPWDYQRWGEKSYPVILAFVFLTACLGYALFISVVAEKRKEGVFKGMGLTSLLSIPVLLKPSLAFSVLKIRNAIAPKLDVGSVIASLISRWVGGIFVLFGLCAGVAAVLIWFNDRYGTLKGVVSIFRSDSYLPPSIRFSKLRGTPILICYALYLAFFQVFFHPNESWLIIFPVMALCFTLPIALVSLAGLIFSSLVIAMSITQKKNLYALAIFVCGLSAGWKGAYGEPVIFLMYYGALSGLIALILWAISDFRGHTEPDGTYQTTNKQPSPIPFSIGLSRNPFASSYILLGVIFAVILGGSLLKGISRGTPSLLLFPLMEVAAVLVCFGAFYLSLLVIFQLLYQKRFVPAAVVLLCGLAFAMVLGRAASREVMFLLFPLPPVLGFYSLGAGLTSLLLWVISDVFEAR